MGWWRNQRRKKSTREKANAWQSLSRSVKEAGPAYQRRLGWVALFSLSSLIPLALVLRYCELLIDAKDPVGGMIRILLIGGAAVLAVSLASYGALIVRESTRLALETDLRRKILHQIHGVSLEMLESPHRGAWIKRLRKDLGHAEKFLVEQIPDQVKNLTLLIASSVLCFFFFGKVAIFSLAAAGAIFWLTVAVQRRVAPLKQGARHLRGAALNLFLESMEGVRTIRSHSAEPYVHRRFEEQMGDLTVELSKVSRRAGMFLSAQELFSQVLFAALMVLSALGYLAGELDPRAALFVPCFIYLYLGVARSLAQGIGEWELPPKGRLVTQTTLVESSINRYQSYRGFLPERDQVGAVVMENLVFENGGDLGKPLYLRVTRGSLVSVTGRSACGKSKFLEVLAGLRPAVSGTFRLEDWQGNPIWSSGGAVPLFPIEPFAYVEQYPFLIEGTLRENLTFGNRDRLSDTHLWEVLERVGLYDTARALGGLEGTLRDRGQDLSKGERYLVSFARALLLKRPFLLLDEPFAHLDDDRIRCVVNCLRHERSSTGIVIVTRVLPRDLQASIDQRLDFRALFSSDAVSPVYELPNAYRPFSDKTPMPH